MDFDIIGRQKASSGDSLSGISHDSKLSYVALLATHVSTFKNVLLRRVASGLY